LDLTALAVLEYNEQVSFNLFVQRLITPEKEKITISPSQKHRICFFLELVLRSDILTGFKLKANFEDSF